MPASETGAASSGKIDKVQLGNHMYFNPAYTEVVRVIGYAGFPFRELDDRLKPLAERFGGDKIREVCRELMTLLFDGKEKRSGRQDDAEVRLKPEVRKLAWQLLGPPPEYKPVDMIREVVSSRQPLKENEKPPVPNKTRRERTAAAPTADAAEAPSATPILQQYREAKERHPNMLLLFRIGDFYELFENDAETASKLLGLVLTTREKLLPMAGFPHHSLETHLRKLLQAGHRVAICDQADGTHPTETVRREVTRIVSPGVPSEGVSADARISPQQQAHASGIDVPANTASSAMQPPPHAALSRKHSAARKRRGAKGK